MAAFTDASAADANEVRVRPATTRPLSEDSAGIQFEMRFWDSRPGGRLKNHSVTPRRRWLRRCERTSQLSDGSHAKCDAEDWLSSMCSCVRSCYAASRADAVAVPLLNDCPKGAFAAATWLYERRVIAAVPNSRNAQFDAADPRVPLAINAELEDVDFDPEQPSSSPRPPVRLRRFRDLDSPDGNRRWPATSTAYVKSPHAEGPNWFAHVSLIDSGDIRVCATHGRACWKNTRRSHGGRTPRRKSRK